MLSETYKEEKTKVIGNETKSLSDTLDKLWKLNGNLDTSCVVTRPTKETFKKFYLDIHNTPMNNEDVYLVIPEYKENFYNNKNYYCKTFYLEPRTDLRFINHDFNIGYFDFTETSSAQSPFQYISGINYAETSTIGDGSKIRLIRNFKFSDYIYPLIIYGYTKEEFESAIAAGSFPTRNLLHLDDVASNPSNYIINDYSINSNRVYHRGTDGNFTYFNLGEATPCVIVRNERTTGIIPITVYISSTGIGINENLILITNSSSNVNWTGTVPPGIYNAMSTNIRYTPFNATNFVLDASDLSEPPEENIIYKSSDNIDLFTYTRLYTSGTNKQVTSETRRYCTGEYLIEFLASFGCYFIDYGRVGTLNSDKPYKYVWLGEMNEKGYTTGNLLNSSQLDDYNGFNKDGAGYNPDFKPVDTVNSLVSLPFTKNIDMKPPLNGYYCMSVDEFETFKQNIEHVFIPLAHYNEYILGIWSSYLDLPHFSGLTKEATLKIEDRTFGNYQQIQKTTFLIEAGSIYCAPKFNSYLDYEPFTTIHIYIPMCGYFPLPCNIFMGQYIKVYYQFSLVDGMVTAYINYYDESGTEFPYTMVNGNMYGSIPITIEDIASNYSAKISFAVNAVNAVASASAGISGYKDNSELSVQRISASAATVGGTGARLYESLVNTSIVPETVSTNGSANTRMSDPHKLCLFINRVRPTNNPIYGKIKGYACSFVSKVKDLHGYNVVEHPHIDIKMTSAEKDELYKIMTSGFRISDDTEPDENTDSEI